MGNNNNWFYDEPQKQVVIRLGCNEKDANILNIFNQQDN